MPVAAATAAEPSDGPMLTTINKNPNPIIPYEYLLVMVTPLAVGTENEL